MSRIPIALCADRNMEVALHAAMFSLLRSCSKSSQPHFYVALPGYDATRVELLRTTLNRTGKPYGLTLLEPEVGRFKHLRSLHGNFMTYARLLLPSLIPEERFLYLDADTLIQVDVAPLFEIGLGGKAAAFVVDGVIRWSIERTFYGRLGLDLDGPYFNAGVMLVDCAAWQRNKVFERCMDFCEKYASELLSADQTVLNYVLFQDVHELDHRYNRACYPNGKNSTENRDGIFHYVGSPKPWDLLGEWVHSSYPDWSAVARETACGTATLSKYFRASNYRRALRISGSYGRCLSSHMKQSFQKRQ